MKFINKIILVFIFIASPVSVSSETITFSWDANTETDEITANSAPSAPSNFTAITIDVKVTVGN